MKTYKAFYMDDGVSVPGVLVKRFLRKPVFLASDTRCGWQKQIITKKETKNVVRLIGAPGSGKIRYCTNTKE